MNNIYKQTFNALAVAQTAYLCPYQKDSITPFKWLPPTLSYSPPPLPSVKLSSLTTIPPFSQLIAHCEAPTSQEISEALRLIELDFNNFRNLSRSMKDNKQVVLAAVTQYGRALEFASKRLQDDKDIALAAVTQYGWALEFASKKLQDDKDIALAAIKHNGHFLSYASKSLQDDKDVVLAAIKHNGYALQHASKRLQNDKDVVLAAVTQNGEALQYASYAIRNNKEIALAAVRQDADAYKYVGETLRNDPEILKIVKGPGKLLPFDIDIISQIIDELKKNKDGVIPLFASEQTFKDGPVDTTKVQNFLTLLRKEAKEGIYFDKPESSSLSGGTCSAMSLTFAYELLSTKKPITNLTEFKNALKLLSSKMDTKECITKSCPSLRNLQMAFNAIRVDKQKKLDFSQHKIESLARVYDLSIKTTSKPIAIRSNEAKSVSKEEIEKLPKGIYLIRALNKGDNEKLENFGHSLLFIKADDFIGLYDPSVGMTIASSERLVDFIQNTVLFSLRRYALDEARFYEIEHSKN